MDASGQIRVGSLLPIFEHIQGLTCLLFTVSVHVQMVVAEPLFRESDVTLSTETHLGSPGGPHVEVPMSNSTGRFRASASAIAASLKFSGQIH